MQQNVSQRKQSSLQNLQLKLNPGVAIIEINAILAKLPSILLLGQDP